MGLPDLQFQLYVDGVWTTYPATFGEGWSSRIGPDIETGTQPNQLSVTVVNNDLSMDPSNVSSALYGKIGQNTPARILDSGVTLTWTEASTWEPDATVDHNVSTGRGRAWVTLSGAGLLQRLSRWEDPLDSPMTRQTASYSSLIGHMPLEDPSGSANFTQLVPKVRPGYYRGAVTLAGDSGAGGSGPCVTLGVGGYVTGSFRTPTGSGYQIAWAAKLAALPSTATYAVVFAWSDTIGRTWNWMVNNTNHQIIITDETGTLDTVTFAYGTIPPNQWIRYRMKVTVSGSTLTYEPAYYAQDGTGVGITDSFSSSTTGRPRQWQIVGNTWTDGAAFTGVFAVTDTSLDLIGGDAANAFDGYLGERAAYRYARLTAELGLIGYGGGDANQTPMMGRQKPGRALDLIQECVTTDGGLLYDEPYDIALSFIYANELANQAVTLALTKTTHVAPPLRKVIGDVGTVNDVTITNWDGTAVRLEQSTGRKSTSPPPAGVGRYKLPLDVSCYDSDLQLIDRGNWELAKGTLDRPRYKQLVINLLANPSLRTTINFLRPGNLISLTGVEPDTVYLLVITIERSGSDTEDKAILSCLPADVWQGGVYDDGVTRYDSASTTLGTGRDTTQTSWTFSTSDRADCWSTTSTPYDVLVTGERMTVTSMGAVTGTGPWTQTATVTRSVNGVIKAHTAGEEIHVFKQGRYALGGW